MSPQILRALIESLSVPVSCKIRLLPTQDATIDLVKRIVGTGISSLTVHCRTKDMRPREPALLDRLRDIVDAVAPFGIPVVANGDCLGFDDMQRIKDLTGRLGENGRLKLTAGRRFFHHDRARRRSQHVCLSQGRHLGLPPSRAAVHSRGTTPPRPEDAQTDCEQAHALGNQFGNSKYCLNAMDFKSTRKGVGAAQLRKELKQALGQAKDYAQLARAFEAELCADPRSWQDLLSKPWLQSEAP
jgi:tRNA-dihydrouridine synthase 2